MIKLKEVLREEEEEQRGGRGRATCTKDYESGDEIQYVSSVVCHFRWLRIRLMHGEFAGNASVMRFVNRSERRGGSWGLSKLNLKGDQHVTRARCSLMAFCTAFFPIYGCPRFFGPTGLCIYFSLSIRSGPRLIILRITRSKLVCNSRLQRVFPKVSVQETPSWITVDFKDSAGLSIPIRLCERTRHVQASQSYRPCNFGLDDTLVKSSFHLHIMVSCILGPSIASYKRPTHI